jgi:O-antigen ligase
VQVSDFTAVALGLIVVLWFCGEMSRRLTLFAVLATSTLLLLTHTRTEVIALVAGILVAGLRIFGTQARVRRTFALVAIVVSITVTIFSGVLTTWLARGQDTSELTKLTGRTTVWADVLNAPRDRFQLLFGYGLSNKGFNGLPIDSNWIAAYYDLGLIGVAICIACVLFVLVSAYFQRRTARTALALFLVTYLLITSFTETGLSDASGYLLELALAASLLVTPVEEGGPG